MNSPRGVVLDLGRVLVDIDLERGLLSHLTGSCADGLELMRRLKRDGLFTGLCSGAIAPEEFYARILARTGLRLGFEAFRAAWCDIFCPMPGMPELVEELLAAGLPLCILSDTDPMHWEYLRARFPCVGRIPHAALSYEVGAVKPDPRMYLAASALLGLRPSACFFTDDLEENVLGARRAGMRAEVFAGPAGLREHLARLELLK